MRTEKVNPAWNRTGTTINANTVARARADQQNHSQGGLQPDRRGNRQQRTLPTPDMRQSSAPPPMQSGRRETPGGVSRGTQPGGMGGDKWWREAGGGIAPGDMTINRDGPGGQEDVYPRGEPGGGFNDPGSDTQIIRDGPGAGILDRLDSPEAQWAKQFHAQYGAWPPGFDWIPTVENGLQSSLYIEN